MAQPSTQNFIALKEIKQGVLVLKNNALRGVLMVSSVNFALKSEDEQSAITYQFQSFLNSLDFPLQISIQSRKLNITGYLNKIKNLENNQENELLKIQTSEYNKFIRELIRGGQIMSKNFFVVVPFSSSDISMKKKTKTDKGRFEMKKNQLWQRMEFVALGLRRCGLKCSSLNTSELIELFWTLHHPEEAEVGYYPEIPPELTS